MQTSEATEPPVVSADSALETVTRRNKRLTAALVVLGLLAAALGTWLVFDAVRDDSREYVLFGADELSSIQQQRIELLGPDGAFTEAWNDSDPAAVVSLFQANGYHENMSGLEYAVRDGSLEAFVGELQAGGLQSMPTDDPMIIWGDYVLLYSEISHPAHGTGYATGLVLFMPESTKITAHIASLN